MAPIRAENSHLGSILCDGTNSKVPQALEASEVSKYLSRVSHLGEGWEGGGVELRFVPNAPRFLGLACLRIDSPNDISNQVSPSILAS